MEGWDDLLEGDKWHQQHIVDILAMAFAHFKSTCKKGCLALPYSCWTSVTQAHGRTMVSQAMVLGANREVLELIFAVENVEIKWIL